MSAAMASVDLSRTASAHALWLDGVSHSVDEGGFVKRTLAPLSSAFEPGQFHVVGGPSGAGKTTLLSILSTTVEPAQGCVHWGDTNLTRLSDADRAMWRRTHLGLVFQTSRLISVMTVAEHIRIAAAARGDASCIDEGRRVLDLLGLGDKHHAMPAQLSGGEKQRVAIAQAMCARPAILLADEPTAALDQANALLVAQTFRRFAHERGAVVVCVSHDRVVMDAADQLLMLDKA